MKYVVTGLALVAAIAALIWRPPTLSGRAPAPAARADAARSSVPAARPLGARPSIVRKIVVYVAGEVVRPGLYSLPPETRAADALARAGGPKADADLVAVNLAAPLEDGQEVAFRKIGERVARRRIAIPRATSARAAKHHGHRRRSSEPAQAAAIVDLNSADERRLATLPGVGPALAARIVEFREANGRFTSVDELADVAGITLHLQDELTPSIVVR